MFVNSSNFLLQYFQLSITILCSQEQSETSDDNESEATNGDESEAANGNDLKLPSRERVNHDSGVITTKPKLARKVMSIP